MSLRGQAPPAPFVTYHNLGLAHVRGDKVRPLSELVALATAGNASAHVEILKMNIEGTSTKTARIPDVPRSIPRKLAVGAEGNGQGAQAHLAVAFDGLLALLAPCLLSPPPLQTSMRP